MCAVSYFHRIKGCRMCTLYIVSLYDYAALTTKAWTGMGDGIIFKHTCTFVQCTLFQILIYFAFIFAFNFLKLHVCACLCLHVCMCLCICACVCSCVSLSICVCVRVCLHVRVPVFMRRSEDSLQETLVSFLCGSWGLNLNLQAWG